MLIDLNFTNWAFRQLHFEISIIFDTYLPGYLYNIA